LIANQYVYAANRNVRTVFHDQARKQTVTAAHIKHAGIRRNERRKILAEYPNSPAMDMFAMKPS
jgi:hypothetical protein